MLANLASYIAYVPSADTFSAAATTVGALDRLLALRDRGICARAQALDTLKLHVAVTALRGSRQLLQVQVTVLTVRRLHNAPTVRPRVVGVTLAKGETLSHLQFLLVPTFMNCARETGHVTMAAPDTLECKEYKALHHVTALCAFGVHPLSLVFFSLSRIHTFWYIATVKKLEWK